MPPVRRDRARVVCNTCHDRKVRCNLQDSVGRKCSNCRRNNLHCVVWAGPRSGQLPELLQPAAQSSGHQPERSNSGADIVNVLQSAPGPEEARVVPHSPTTGSYSGTTALSSFVGAHTLLAYETSTQSPAAPGARTDPTAPLNTSASLMEAAVLPKPPLLTALIESYFKNVFHRYPVADRADLVSPECSTLLTQAVCMAGSLMRNSSRVDGLAYSHSLYDKTKSMLFLGDRSDLVGTLAALCLMICWSPNPTDLVSLDCPWQWTGTAIRLACQMGLHREATYRKRPEASRLRRMWWILVNADRLQAACFGRPLAVRSSDCNTRLPSLADFNHTDTSALVFVHYASVIAVWGEIADFGIRAMPASVDDIKRLTDSLCIWIASLPEDIRLFSSTGLRHSYRQSVSELHMVYFVTIILLEALSVKSHEQWSTSVAAIVAGSSVATLIEEVDCWEDLSSMSSTTTFYILAASIPLIYQRTGQQEKRDMRDEELRLLCSVLDRMAPRWGGAPVVRQNIEKICHQVESQVSAQPRRSREQSPSGALAPAVSQRYRLQELFPFPTSLCPNMDRLNMLVDDPLDFGTTILFPREDTLTWTNTDSQWYWDLFRLNMHADDIPTVVDGYLM